MKRVLISVFIFLLIANIYAGEYRTGKTIIITDSLKTDLYSSADYFSITSVIKGDVWAAVGSASLKNASVENLYLISGDIDITNSKINNAVLVSGDVKLNSYIAGSLKIIGGYAVVNSTVEKDVILIGGKLIIEKDAVIYGDLIIYGGDVEIHGNINGNVKGDVNTFKLFGNVNKSVDLKVTEDILLSQNSKIQGDLNIESKKQLTINDGIVKGKVNFEKIYKPHIPLGKILFILNLFCFLSALITSMFIVLAMKKWLSKLNNDLNNTYLLTIAFGFAGIIGIPILVIILLGLILTIPLSIIIASLSFILLYLGKIFLGIFIGWKLLYLINKEEPNLYLAALVGIGTLYGLFFIPFLGILIYIFATIWGLGVSLKMAQIIFIKS